MKHIIILSISLLFTITSFSQNINGSWSGTLNAGGVKLPLVLNISGEAGAYTATIDSPLQGAKGIPVTAVSFEKATLTFSIANAGIEYEGTWQSDSIVGTFKQNGMTFPLNLKKTEGNAFQLNRPQEPKPPYPYRSEDVTFENKPAGITLAGTLTLPKDGENFPAVVLITGSGPQNRDEEIMGHKPFLVLSDYLTRNGIAVLRYDDRGTAQSGGNYSTATLDDFVADAAAAIDYLKARKEINQHEIGLMGHSEGGVIAPMIAARSNDLAFIIMLAGTGLRGDSILLLQNELAAKAEGMSEDKIAKSSKFNALIYNKIIDSKGNITLQEMTDWMISEKDKFAEFIPQNIPGDEFIKKSAEQMTSPWMQYFICYDPAPALKKVKCPVLALNGEKDLQVSADVNLNRVKELVKSPVTIKKYPGLNHLFQHCTTGLPAEYGNIEETISPEVLSDIVEWIKQVVR